jgi:hypothetical protein
MLYRGVLLKHIRNVQKDQQKFQINFPTFVRSPIW